MGHKRTRLGQQQPPSQVQGAAQPATEEVPEAEKGRPTSTDSRQRRDQGGQQLRSRLLPLTCTESTPGMGPWQLQLLGDRQSA